MRSGRSRTEITTHEDPRRGRRSAPARRRRRWTARAAAGLAGATLLGAAAVAPATGRATGGEVGGEGDDYFLSNSISTVGEIEFSYGRPGDRLYVGDWNGDGTDTLGVRRGRTYFLRNSLTPGPGTVIAYGAADDVTYVGDWDGDGRDSFAVRRGSVFYIRNAAGSGAHDATLAYGRASDDVLIGDWDRNGRDDVAVRRGNEYFFRTSPGDGPADRVATYGRVGDEVLVGDWNGDGFDTLGVRRGRTYFLRNAISTGVADVTIDYGRPDDVAMVGDWDGNGTDTLGVRRPSPPPPQPVQYPIASYGTLRTGQPAHHVVHSDAVRERTLRLPGFDLWLTPRTEFDWPWAIPNGANTSGIVAEAFWFAPGEYSRMIAKVDRWEGYDPSLPLSRMNYTRELRGTDVSGQLAWVYVATPWRVAYAHDIGWIVRSGDYVNRY
ncbi:gamma-glutamylcyclotransferase family protein [Georgenia sp. Z1491]|uniref:gamma-glutamylcyclotransferase family protein n=1 Tax=Georgenia sp. Z1491 TaxID=3416707 RepID=UPI003CEF2F6F